MKQMGLWILIPFGIAGIYNWTHAVSEQPVISPVFNININTNHESTLTSSQVSFSPDFATRVIKWQDSLWRWIKQHRYWIAGTSIALMGCSLITWVYTAKKYLADTTHWAAWKAEISLATLLATAPDKLTKELILDIQQRYTNPTNPVNIVDPIITFIATTKQEKSKLLQYQTLHTWLTTTRMGKCIPGYQNQQQIIKERLERLAYVTMLFNQWLAQYNVTHAGLFTA
jgi:hypothetical protein